MNDEEFTPVERQLLDLRSGGAVDPADVDALLDSSDPTDKRAGLRALALTADDRSDDELPSLAPFLSDPNPDVRYNALQVAVELLRERAEPTVDTGAVVDRLNDESDRVAEKALGVASVVAKRDVETAREATDDVVRFLDSERSEIRKLAVRFLVILVRERPGDPSVPLARLAEMLGETYEPLTFDDDHFTAALSHTQTRKDLVTHSHEERERHMTLREFVAETLVVVAGERSDELRAHEATFRPYLTHGDPHVREQTLRVYTALGDRRPGVVLGVVDEVTACLDADHPDSLRAAAVKPLGLAASEAPDSVVPALLDRVGVLVGLLGDDDPHVRGSALGLLSLVADRDPAAVDRAEEEVVDLLDDEHAFVRGNAVWALGSLGSERAAAALRDRRADEPDPEVRASIDDALGARSADDPDAGQ